MPESITVPIPLILYLSIGRRMYYNRDEAEDPTGEIMGAVCYSFLPPDSTSKWPKTIDDIGNDQVQWLLKCAKNGAAGILCNGKVYTDDSLFWLSKIEPGSKLRFVYERGEESEYVERQRFCAFVPWTYIDEHPHFVRPAPGTPILFECLWDWDRIKQKYHMPRHYGREEVNRVEELPPPYEP